MNSKKINYIFSITILIWTLIIAVLFFIDMLEIERTTNELIKTEAEANFNKDQAIRKWVASHGGIYVFIDSMTPPSKYLSHIEDRDIETSAGKKLTLMNPAYMIRQMNESFAEDYGVVGHITSLKLLRPENKPDDWEHAALEQFETGITEVSNFDTINGEDYYRLIKPMNVTPNCLKCHPHQNYNIGDIRGGVAVSLPIKKHLKNATLQQKHTILTYVLLWLIVNILLIFIYIKFKKELEIKIRAEQKIEAQHTEIQKKNEQLELFNKNLEEKVKERTEELAESEQKLRGYIDNAPDGVFVVDANGRYLEVNTAAEKITGYSKAELLSMSVSQVTPSREGEYGEKSFAELKKTGSSKSEGVFFHKSGEKRWWSVDSVKLSETRYIEFRKDITERKQAEEQIRKLSIAVEQSPSTVVITDLNGDIEYVNPKFSETTGYSAEEAMGKNTRILKSDETSSEEYKDMWETISSGNEWRGEFHNKRKNGELYWELASISPIRDDQGVFTHYIAIKEDITERKLAEEALKGSEAKYRTIIEHSGDAIAIRQKGGFEFANEAFSKMLDYSILELLEIENSLIFDSNILNDMEKRVSKNDLNENLSIQFETMIKKKDQSKIDVEIFEKNISYKEEKAQLVIVRDITKQKAIMKDLQRGAEQTKGLNDFIPICAGCSLIHDEEKENKPWVKPAEYITERLPEIKFSHGMCPECMKKWYPKFDFGGRK